MEIKDIFSLRVKDIISLIMSIPITIYVNFKCLPLKKAIKLPLFIAYNTQIDRFNGKIEFGCEPKPWLHWVRC